MDSFFKEITGYGRVGGYQALTIAMETLLMYTCRLGFLPAVAGYVCILSKSFANIYSFKICKFNWMKRTTILISNS